MGAAIEKADKFVVACGAALRGFAGDLRAAIEIHSFAHARALPASPLRAGLSSFFANAYKARLKTPSPRRSLATLARVQSVISVSKVVKTYASGFQALKGVNLEIERGEIFALLGPNGAGKTTLINIICGIVNLTSGTVLADGHDVVRDYRAARSKIGLVPQELTTDAFESVWATVTFSRGLFGKPPNPAFLEKVLRDLSLWDKKDSRIMTLSGGMKRRVMIAKALSHEPSILFLDEPSAGVDVELRRDMWKMVRGLRESGVTIILTTHYIEEAEEMADRIGVINKGEIILVEQKAALMRKLGKKQLTLQLKTPLERLPSELAERKVELSESKHDLIYTFDTQSEETGIASLLRKLGELGIEFKDLYTKESSLEDIFVNLVRSER
jgi:ABC-2 type transport system ATP-binding protein